MIVDGELFLLMWICCCNMCMMCVVDDVDVVYDDVVVV